MTNRRGKSWHLFFTKMRAALLKALSHSILVNDQEKSQNPHHKSCFLDKTRKNLVDFFKLLLR